MNQPPSPKVVQEAPCQLCGSINPTYSRSQKKKRCELRKCTICVQRELLATAGECESEETVAPKRRRKKRRKKNVVDSLLPTELQIEHFTGVQPIMAEVRHKPQPRQRQPQAQTEKPSHEGAAEGSLALQSTLQPNTATAPTAGECDSEEMVASKRQRKKRRIKNVVVSLPPTELQSEQFTAQPRQKHHSLAFQSTSQPNSSKSVTAPILPPLNEVDLCGETAADVVTTPQAPSLAQPNDGEYLSEKSVYARLHLFELFAATPEDCAKKVKGRIHKPIVEQVGLKCACCGTDYYAKGMEHMKTAADTLLRRHTMKCSSISDELKAEFQKLKQNGPKNTGMTVPNYWIHCLVESGVYEEEGRLLYNPSSEENP